MRTESVKLKSVVLAIAICLGNSFMGDDLYAEDFQGVVDFRVRVDLVALTDGRVEAVRAEVGDVVMSGTVLVELDSTRQDADERISASNVEVASIAVKELEEELERQEALFEQGSLSLTAYDKAVDNLKRARAELVVAQGRLIAAQHAVDQTKLRAPFDAMVENRNVEEGMAVRMMDETQRLMTLVSAGEFIVRLEVPLSLRTSLQGDGDAAIAVEGRNYDGKIAFGSLKPDQAGNFPVFVKFTERELLLFPGMQATVTFH